MTPLLTGLSLGFGAGVSPGPLTTLVLTTTLERGFSAGLRVAIAPLLTDAPIILVCVLLVSALPDGFATFLALGGGLYVGYLGLHTLYDARQARLEIAKNVAPPRQDIWRGFLVNLLSPNPWLFWLSVGSPVLTTAWRTTLLGAFGFLAGFYLLLVGSKIGVAWAVAGGRHYLTETAYRWLLAGSGLLLIFFGGVLLKQALLAFTL